VPAAVAIEETLIGKGGSYISANDYVVNRRKFYALDAGV
jgi:hypothetical protein